MKATSEMANGKIITTKNRFFCFGIMPDKPALPVGWTYHEREGHWLTATDPQGLEWFAGRDKLCRRMPDGSADTKTVFKL